MAMQRKRRRRSGGNNNGNNNPNRHFESNGPDVRIRGSAQQILEKYLQYARDAQTSGDRIKAEGLFQHAEHYARIVAVFEKQKEEERREREERDAKRAEERAAREADSGESSVDETEAVSDVTSTDAPASSDNADETRDAPAPRRRSRRTKADADEKAEDGASDVSEDDAPKPRRRRRSYAEKDAGDDADGVMKTLSRGVESEPVPAGDGDL